MKIGNRVASGVPAGAVCKGGSAHGPDPTASTGRMAVHVSTAILTSRRVASALADAVCEGGIAHRQDTGALLLLLLVQY